MKAQRRLITRDWYIVYVFSAPTQCFVDVKLPKEKSLNRKAVDETNYFNSCRKIKDMTPEAVDAVLTPLNLTVTTRLLIHELQLDVNVGDLCLFGVCCSTLTRRRLNCSTLASTSLSEVLCFPGSPSTAVPTRRNLLRSRSFTRKLRRKDA